MFLICKKAGLARAYFEYAPQEILENTVRLWYQEYKKAGGLPDPIAEEIFKEPASVINLRQ